VPPSEEEIKRIIELYNDGNGLSQGEIAKELGRSKSTINEWLHKILKGEQFANETERKKAQTRNATIAKKAWDHARIIELNDRFLEIVKERIERNPSGNDLKSLATTYAIMIDKRKILEPDPTRNSGSNAIIAFVEAEKAKCYYTKEDNIDS
jgi:IS30 family transposase